MNQTLKYEFTPDERRVVSAAYRRYMEVVGVIAELHGFQGNLAVDPNRGFLEPPEPQGLPEALLRAAAAEAENVKNSQSRKEER